MEEIKKWTVLGKDKPFEAKEDFLQTQCMGWFRIQYGKKIGFHVPNGGNRNMLEGKKFKNMGVVSGVSDILILNSSRGYHGLVVELKRAGGKVRDNQKAFLQRMSDENYKCVVVYNFDAFRDLVNWYFGEKSNYDEVSES